MAHYRLFFDGSCGPKNPGGTAAYGFALFKDGEESAVHTGSGVIGTGPGMSNNVAEFSALYEGLAAFAELENSRAVISVFGDSNLVIRVMCGHWKAKADKLYYSYYKLAEGIVKNLRSKGHVITFDWVPRELNQVCDDLSKAHQK